MASPKIAKEFRARQSRPEAAHYCGEPRDLSAPEQNSAPSQLTALSPTCHPWQGPSRGQPSCQLSVFLSEKICWLEVKEKTKASTGKASIVSQHSPRQEPHGIPSSALLCVAVKLVSP